MTIGEEQQGQLEDWYAVGETVNVFTHKAVTFVQTLAILLFSVSVPVRVHKLYLRLLHQDFTVINRRVIGLPGSGGGRVKS